MIRRNETDQKVWFRLPEEIKTWIEEKAAEDERSQNAFVVRLLRARMDADRAAG
jgi:predicted HicB family RNase H-like nuclease